MKKQKIYRLLLPLGVFLLVACGQNGNQNSNNSAAVLGVLNGTASETSASPEAMLQSNASLSRDIQSAFAKEMMEVLLSTITFRMSVTMV